MVGAEDGKELDQVRVSREEGLVGKAMQDSRHPRREDWGWGRVERAEDWVGPGLKIVPTGGGRGRGPQKAPPKVEVVAVVVVAVRSGCYEPGNWDLRRVGESK